MRVFHQKSSDRGKEYYAASDYYEGGPEQLKGIWIGKGARLLDLKGEVHQEQFDRLVDNLHPWQDKRLTQRNHTNRRVLTDITFSAPKSVSILFGLSGDENIANAVRDAAQETFEDLELDAQTRINLRRGELKLKPTQNIVAGMWLHLTGRPVPDPEIGTHPDMQLHVHGALLNATFDKDRKRWTAVDLSNVVRDSGYYDALFMSRLATKMKELGYGIVRSEHNFEIAGVSRSTIEKFSRRSNAINDLVQEGVAEKIAAKEGITLSDAKDRIGAMSRQDKSGAYSMKELPSVWRSRLSLQEKDDLSRVLSKEVATTVPSVDAERAVEFAKQHQFERQSVVRKRLLVKDALMFGLGAVDSEQMNEAFHQGCWIKDGTGADELLSTPEVLAEERQLLAFARNGLGTEPPLKLGHELLRDWLSDEQQIAVKDLLESNDRIQILAGRAGVGKTTLMSEAIEAIESTGKQVTVLAPTTDAAFDVLAKEGFDAETLASFLLSNKLQQQAQNGVIWIDEAGLVGGKDMAQLVSVAQECNARIILSGDDRQHKSVARGNPLTILQTEAGIKPKTVTKIRRQTDTGYRDAVEQLSRGNALIGLNKLDDLGYVHQLPDSDRYSQLAKDYADAIESKKSTLVIAPTHAERRIVNEAIRLELKSRGHIHDDDRMVGMLRSKRLTQAQRTDVHSYQIGDVIEFVTQGQGGFRPGDRLNVSEVRSDCVLADSSRGQVKVPLGSPRSFDVYRWRQEPLAAGDQIRITKKDKANRLYNGTMVCLDGFTKDGKLQLSNGRTIASDWGHIDYGNTITSYASQGKTYDRVLVAQSTVSFPASDPSQLYVTASRGRQRIDIYTDDVLGLKKAVGKDRSSLSATQLAHRSMEAATPMRRLLELRLQATKLFQKRLQEAGNWVEQAVFKPRRELSR